MIDWPAIITRELEDEDKDRDEPPYIFHPSTLGTTCKRQAYRNKLGMATFDRDALGSMKVGSCIHEWLEEHVTPETSARAEVPYQRRDPSRQIVITGTTDAIDKDGESLYDFKTTANLGYCKDEPKNSHVRQVHLYMWMTGARKAQIIYLDKYKLKPVVHDVTYRQIVADEVLDWAAEIYEDLQGDDIAEKKVQYEDLPEKCGCWLCKREGDK